MKVEDLQSLSAKTITHSQKQKTEEYFQTFLNLLQQSLCGRRDLPVAEHKNNLFTSLRSFDQMPLTYGEKNIFQILSFDDFVGSKAINEIEDILYDEKFDPVGVLENIDKKFRRFKEFIERNQAIHSTLQLIPTKQETCLREGEALLEITFNGETSINTIRDFEWIDQWAIIIRAFSELVGDKPENARIVSVQNASPMSVILATASVFAVALGQAINMVLVMVEKYHRIRVLAEEICRLELENAKIGQDLVLEAAAFFEKSFREIAKILTAEAKPKSPFEVENLIRLAVKNLIVFIDKGGRVNFPHTPNEIHAERDVLPTGSFPSSFRDLHI